MSTSSFDLDVEHKTPVQRIGVARPGLVAFWHIGPFTDDRSEPWTPEELAVVSDACDLVEAACPHRSRFYRQAPVGRPSWTVWIRALLPLLGIEAAGFLIGRGSWWGWALLPIWLVLACVTIASIGASCERHRILGLR